MKNHNRPGITIEKLERFFNKNPRLQKPFIVVLVASLLLAILFVAMFVKYG